MKNKWLYAAVAACLLAASGCSKKEQSETEAPAPPAAAAAPAAATEPLPPGGDIDELIRLGEIGHVRKIMEKLDEIERGRPDCGDFVIRMRTIMNAFDLKRYATALEEARAAHA